MKLTGEQVQSELQSLPEWTLVGENIQRTLVFKDFLKAMAFVNKIAERAEQVQHHPDILIRWNKVTVTLSTHDEGGITEKDFAMARDAERLAGTKKA